MKLEERFTSFRAPGLFLPELAWNPPEEEPFLQSNRIDRSIAHLAAFDGVDSQLLKTTSGALQVTGGGFEDLELALCGAGDIGLDDLDAAFTSLELALTGAGDKGLDDVLTEALALKLALCGATDKGLDDVWDQVRQSLYHAGYGDAIAVLEAIRIAVESMDVILTDVYYATGGYLKTHETA